MNCSITRFVSQHTLIRNENYQLIQIIIPRRLIEKSPSDLGRLSYLETCFWAAAEMRAVIVIKSPTTGTQLWPLIKEILRLLQSNNTNTTSGISPVHLLSETDAAIFPKSSGQQQQQQTQQSIQSLNTQLTAQWLPFDCLQDTGEEVALRATSRIGP